MTLGATSSSCSRRYGMHVAISSGSGLRLLGRAALDDVADVNFVALVAHRRDHAIEQLPGLADERKPCCVLVGAGPLADEAKLRRGIAAREHGLRASRVRARTSCKLSISSASCTRRTFASSPSGERRLAPYRRTRARSSVPDDAVARRARPGARARSRRLERASPPPLAAHRTSPRYSRRASGAAARRTLFASRHPGRSGLHLPLGVNAQLFRQAERALRADSARSMSPERPQVALGVERRHAAGAGRGDRLAENPVLHVAAGEHAGHAGLRSCRAPS